jgi:fructose-bisphosphate aldolase class I
MTTTMRDKITHANGFIAALDQSGGSTPKALSLYGVEPSAYANDSEMFDKVHTMRARIVNSVGFSGDRILGAILFEDTLLKKINGLPSARYLWEEKGIVSFLKIDQGLAEMVNGCQCMSPMDNLDTLLDLAVEHGVFGTKMRSVIHEPDPMGISTVVVQQFVIAEYIISAGLVPIIEPEININCLDKAVAEAILFEELFVALNGLPNGQQVILKITLPEEAKHYTALANHPNVLRVVALSGGYSQAQANEKLSQNPQVIASFSRALTQGLTESMDAVTFDAMLAESIDRIYQASVK